METAGLLLQEGANLSLVDLSAEALSLAESRLSTLIPGQDSSSRILIIQGDVTSEAQVQDSIQKTVGKFGRIDCAFLNAGISYAATSIFDTTEESYERIMNVNVKSGLFSTCRILRRSQVLFCSFPWNQTRCKSYA